MRAVEPRERQLRRRYPLGQRRAAGPPAPPRDRSQFAAGGRIQPRAAIRPRAAAATDPMWTPLLAATKCAHQPLHPLPQSLLTCYCPKSAERSRLTHSRRVAHRPWAAGPVRSLAAHGRQECRLPAMLRQRRQADYLKPSFLLAPNRSADDQCQECPEGITRDARSAPLTVIVCGSNSGGGKDAMPVLHAGPSLVSGTWATQRDCWLLTAPTLPWPEGLIRR